MEVSAIAVSQYREAIEVAAQSFDRFDAPDYSDYGRTSFLAYASFWSFSLRQLKGHVAFCTRSNDNKISGMLEIRENRHITMLFVSPDHVKKGIGKTLVTFAEQYIKQANPSCDKITLNSSPYAFGFYKKMGFAQADELKDEGGFVYIPMEKEI